MTTEPIPLALLDPWVKDPWKNQDSVWCARCAGNQTFVVVEIFENGRGGYCLGCGEERVVPFSRTNSEAA